MKVFRLISRWILSVVFIFSGFVKGVDPLGTAYKIEDYFIAYGTEWAIPLALTLSVLLCATEFTMGVLMLFKVFAKQLTWLFLLMMLFFTAVTLHDALFNPVPDCGCFGEALIITNWQTFYKNLVLLFLVMVIFTGRKSMKSSVVLKRQWVIAVSTVVVFIGFCGFNLMNLPVIDFRPWKVGNKMYNENPEPLQYYLVFKNKTTGEKQEYLSPDYPYNDSLWVDQWEFVDQRVVDPNDFKGHNLQIVNEQGDDFTQQIVRNSGYQFVLVVYDTGKTGKDDFAAINALAKEVIKDDHSFVGVANGLDPIKFAQEMGADYPVYFGDEIELKTMVRANPGLLLLHDGVVLAKWNGHKVPAYHVIKEKYID